MEPELLVKNIRIVDVINKKVINGYITVSSGRFLYTEEGIPDIETESMAKEVVDGKGLYAIPGLIDTHMHIESSFVVPEVFAELTVPHGLSTVLWDFHEIANVAGVEWIERIYKESKGIPLNIYLAVPSCIPATDLTIETPNFQFTKEEVSYLLMKKGVIALGEVMDYKGLIHGNKRILDIVKEAKKHNVLIDGHVPTLTGKDLSLYISYGITSDHTLAHPHKIEEELQKGLWVQIQEKSLTEENISYLKRKGTLERILFVTDDIPPDKILYGHLLSVVNKAISMGLSPFEVLASSTIRAAERIRNCCIGAIAPGREANFFLSENLQKLRPKLVYFRGRLVFDNGRYLYKKKKSKKKYITSCIKIKKIAKEDFKFEIKDRSYVVNAISFNKINSFTTLEEAKVKFKNGFPLLKDDVSLVLVISRNGAHKTVGFVKGLGPREGAIATSYSHDSHPLTVLGKDIEDMELSANIVLEKGGGISVVSKGELLIFVPLPVYGLLSFESGEKIVKYFQELKDILLKIGINHENPTQIITLLTLSVSPLYKISDRGLVDTEKRKLIPIIKGGSV